MLRQSSHILESIPDLLHNISVLKHVAWLPFNYYAFHDDVLSVCFRYPTRLARTLPTKITLEDGSVTDVNLMPMTWAMDTTLLLDPSREYGPVQRYRLREGSNHVVRHVLSTSVPADVRPVDPEWQKAQGLAQHGADDGQGVAAVGARASALWLDRSRGSGPQGFGNR